jgi:hypothetical protein
VAKVDGESVAGGDGRRDGVDPPAMLTLYQSASTTCPGLPWTVLAAIGTIESDKGQSTLPGVHGEANGAGAVFTQNR